MSDAECAASAIIAVLPDTYPAAPLPMVSSISVQRPHRRTFSPCALSFSWDSWPTSSWAWPMWARLSSLQNCPLSAELLVWILVTFHPRIEVLTNALDKNEGLRFDPLEERPFLINDLEATLRNELPSLISEILNRRFFHSEWHDFEDIVTTLFIPSTYPTEDEKCNKLSLGCEVESKSRDDDNVLAKGDSWHFRVWRISGGRIKMAFDSVRRTFSMRLKKKHVHLE